MITTDVFFEELIAAFLILWMNRQLIHSHNHLLLWEETKKLSVLSDMKTKLWKSKVYLAELAAEDILDQGERIEIAHHQGLCDYW